MCVLLQSSVFAHSQIVILCGLVCLVMICRIMAGNNRNNKLCKDKQQRLLYFQLSTLKKLTF